MTILKQTNMIIYMYLKYISNKKIVNS